MRWSLAGLEGRARGLMKWGLECGGGGKGVIAESGIPPRRSFDHPHHSRQSPAVRNRPPSPLAPLPAPSRPLASLLLAPHSLPV